MPINSYEDLVVWQKSIDLVITIYKTVKSLPREELYSLSDQIRRAAVSIPSNIAEGQQRQSSKEFLKFLSIAKGSLGELKTQLIICNRLGFLSEDQTTPLLNECDTIGKMLSGLMNKISENQSRQIPATSHKSLTTKDYD